MRKEVFYIYKYIFVKATVVGTFTEADYHEKIIEYSKKGYRFVTAIPRTFCGYGQIKSIDLVFEIECDEI